MKKFLLFALSIFLCLSSAACIPEDEPTKELAESQVSQAKEEEKYGINESAVFSDLKFTALEIKESGGEDFFVPQKGNVFVGIKFSIENISDEEQTVSTLMLFDGYADDVKCEYSISAACAFDEGTLDGSIAPGKKLVGWYALEVPADCANIELNIQANWLSNNSAKFVFTR